MSNATSTAIGLLEYEDERPRILVLFSSRTETAGLARAIATHLATRGIHVELADAASRPPPPADYDALVVGLSLGFRRDRAVGRYLEWLRSGVDVPAALFVVGSARRCATVMQRPELAGWTPVVIATFPIGEHHDVDAFCATLLRRIDPWKRVARQRW